MITDILEHVSMWIVSVISSWGYGGIVGLMAIESACIPLPSEIIMPFSGYLINTGQFSLLGASLAGGFGCLLGSWVAYVIGRFGGRPMVEKYGKYILISKHDLDLADKWFAKYGNEAIFITRLLPVVRTFISLPAGIAKVEPIKFSIYTLVGSIIWSGLLAYLGMVLGDNWDSLKVYFHRFDIVIGLVILGGLIWWIYRHFRSK